MGNTGIASTAAMSRQEMEGLIVQRAWKDEIFRSEFLADAKGTIEKYAGQKLPADLKVVALAEDDKIIHFVIPPKPADADQAGERKYGHHRGDEPAGTGSGDRPACLEG
jgi:hypothetical protein